MKNKKTKRSIFLTAGVAIVFLASNLFLLASSILTVGAADSDFIDSLTETPTPTVGPLAAPVPTGEDWNTLSQPADMPTAQDPFEDKTNPTVGPLAPTDADLYNFLQPTSTVNPNSLPGSSQVNNPNSLPGSTQVTPAEGVHIPTGAETGLSDISIKNLLTSLLRWLLGIVGVVALIGFVISGIQYIISSGNEDMAKTAKQNMFNSIIGIVVVMASLVIIQAIDYALRGYSAF